MSSNSRVDGLAVVSMFRAGRQLVQMETAIDYVNRSETDGIISNTGSEGDGTVSPLCVHAVISEGSHFGAPRSQN
jgi:hypothetical protein